jgi:hypothetical protein
VGLDTSHGCWHGAYSAFNKWRTELFRVAGYPPLELMEGFTYGTSSKFPPIKWECLKPDPLHILINHSDCDGEIEWKDADAIAGRLEELLPLLPDEDAGGHIGYWREKTQDFIDGLRLAHEKQENVEFH